jgi:hypothetical protein
LGAHLIGGGFGEVRIVRLSAFRGGRPLHGSAPLADEGGA